MAPDRQHDRESNVTITEGQRHRIYEAFRASHGDEVANGLMELLPPVGWADVATTHDLAALEQRMNLRFEALKERMDLRFEALEERMDLRFERTEARFAGLVEAQTLRFVRWTAVIAGLSLAAASSLELVG